MACSCEYHGPAPVRTRNCNSTGLTAKLCKFGIERIPAQGADSPPGRSSGDPAPAVPPTGDGAAATGRRHWRVAAVTAPSPARHWHSFVCSAAASGSREISSKTFQWWDGACKHFRWPGFASSKAVCSLSHSVACICHIVFRKHTF